MLSSARPAQLQIANDEVARSEDRPGPEGAPFARDLSTELLFERIDPQKGWIMSAVVPPAEVVRASAHCAKGNQIVPMQKPVRAADLASLGSFLLEPKQRCRVGQTSSDGIENIRVGSEDSAG